MRRLVWVVLLVVWCFAPQAFAETHQADVQLADGVLRCGWVKVDLNRVGHSDFVAAFNKAMRGASHIQVDPSKLHLDIDPAKLPRSCDSLKQAARIFTATVAPKAYADQKRTWGLLLPKYFDPSKRLVVLIHGLDCNRSNWGGMSELLGSQGYSVATFTYPSDGPIVESVDLLNTDMAALHEAFPQLRISIIAHSLGGLVARGYVEGEKYAGNVDHLILLGTPNQGSSWAAYRVGLEFREHWGLWHNEPNWRLSWAITDGLGEAGRDLKPSSAFLKDLNSRSPRSGVHYTIVAGNKSLTRRIEGDALDGTANLIPQKASGWWGLRQISRGLHNVAESVRSKCVNCDGPVTIKSTRLAGVDDFVVLPADHNSLYASVDGKAPAAWGIIKERLER